MRAGAFSVDGGETWAVPAEVEWAHPGCDPSPGWDPAPLVPVASFEIEPSPAAQAVLDGFGDAVRAEVRARMLDEAWGLVERAVMLRSGRLAPARRLPFRLSFRDLSPLRECRYPGL